jgi:hypothetical protein
MVKVQINVEHKVNVEDNVDYWLVEPCIITIDNSPGTVKLSGEEYKTKDAAIAEMKRRTMKCSKSKGVQRQRTRSNGRFLDSKPITTCAKVTVVWLG